MFPDSPKAWCSSTFSCIATAIGLLLTSSAFAQFPGYYGDASGQDFDFIGMSEQAGGDDFGGEFFEAPAITGNTIGFSPSQFRALSSLGYFDTVNTTFYVDVKSHDPLTQAITHLYFDATGGYGMTGSGTSSTSVSVVSNAYALVVEVNVGGVVQSIHQLPVGADRDSYWVPGPPIQAGAFNLSTYLDVQERIDAVYGEGNAFATTVYVSWNTYVHTRTETASAAEISYLSAADSMTLEVVPEPGGGTMLVAGVVALGLLARDGSLRTRRTRA